MRKAELRRMLDDLKHPAKVLQLCELVRRLYLEHGTAKRVAPLLGLTPAELGGLIPSCPELREARDEALRELSRRRMRALRHRLGVPEPEEEASAPVAPPAHRSKRRGAGGPPLTMTLALDVLPHVPLRSKDEDEEPKG